MGPSDDEVNTHQASSDEARTSTNFPHGESPGFLRSLKGKCESYNMSFYFDKKLGNYIVDLAWEHGTILLFKTMLKRRKLDEQPTQDIALK